MMYWLNHKTNFSGYSADMIITDVKYEYPIFKDDRLREMTKEEKVRNNIPVTIS